MISVFGNAQLSCRKVPPRDSPLIRGTSIRMTLLRCLSLSIGFLHIRAKGLRISCATYYTSLRMDMVAQQADNTAKAFDCFEVTWAGVGKLGRANFCGASSQN